MAVTIKVRFRWPNYSPEEAFDSCALNDPEGVQVDIGSGLRRPKNGKSLWEIDTWLSDAGYTRGDPKEIEHQSGSYMSKWSALYQFEYRAEGK